MYLNKNLTIIHFYNITSLLLTYINKKIKCHEKEQVFLEYKETDEED